MATEPSPVLTPVPAPDPAADRPSAYAAAQGPGPGPGRPRRVTPRRAGLAAFGAAAVAGVVVVSVLASTATDRRTVRVVPAARPGMGVPIDGALAPARREAQPAGAAGVGPGPLAVGLTGAAAPAGVMAAAGSSIQAALDAAGPGGTVIIGAGVHREQFDLRPRDGQLIVGEPGAVLNGSRVVGGFAAAGSHWVAGGQATAPPAATVPCATGFVRCGSPVIIMLYNNTV